MTCRQCAEQRRRVLEAWQNREMTKALAELAKGAAMMAGKMKGKRDEQDTA